MKLANNSSLTIKRLSTLIRRREISPVELTQFVLERIERLQPVLNPFITITADLARIQAKQAEKEIVKGHYRGALHGIPISLKDLFYTRGVRTTAGSRILRNFIPKENAAAAERLFRAGAILVGKTNLHEFAYGATNLNPHYGPVRNPWESGRMSGGSSGGSAVSVTCALALASLGTDTGGSIRIPSAACGCVGLKPTYGRTSLDGVIPLATTLDHVGPLCRCTEDAGLLLDAIADGGPEFWGKQRKSFSRDLRKGLKGLRAGVPRQYFFDHLQPEVRRSVLKAIETMRESGVEIREIELKRMRDTAYLATEITLAEAMAYHWQWLEKRPSDYGPDVRARMLAGRKQLSVTYVLAQQARRAYAEDFARAIEPVDVLLTPTIPVVAPRLDDREVSVGRAREDVRLALLRLTRPGNLSGFPSISVPCGFSAEGLPIGLQITGRPWGEATILRMAYGYERQTDWHNRFPPDPA